MQCLRQNRVALSISVWLAQLCWFSGPSEPECETPRLIRLHDLRSAFLLRDGAASYRNTSAAGRQAELRRHFDAVLALLELNTGDAIETALDRLEAARGETWSHMERELHREELFANRQLQLERLRAYRDRGLFPQNEGHSDHAVPIFVDNHDTACAVGHLMRLAGWEEEVAKIQAANNLVYVPDARDSAVAKWALTAGVTLEEAAVIQPGYPYFTEHLLSEFSGPGEVLVKNGLRYSNFQLMAGNFDYEPPKVPPVYCSAQPSAPFCQSTITPTDVGPFPAFEEIGFLVGEGPYDDNSCCNDFNPDGSHWIIFGGWHPIGDNRFGQYFIDGQASIGRAQKLILRFDVSPVHAGSLIDRIGHASDHYTYGIRVVYDINRSPYADFSMSTRALVNENVVASILDTSGPSDPSNDSNFFPKFSSSASFPPAKAITVEVEFWLQHGADVDSIRVDLNLLPVPEPRAIVPWLIGIGWTLIARRAKFL